MPAPPALDIDDFVLLVARAYINGQVGEITCGMKVSAVTSGSVTLLELAPLFQVKCDTELPAVLPPSAIVINCYVARFNKVNGKITESAFGASTRPPGTVGTDSEATQVAAVVKKVTGFSGPGKRGRLFFPFVPADFVDSNGELTNAGATAYGSVSPGLFTTTTYTGPGGDATLVPILIKRSPLPLSGTDIQRWVPSGKLGTQKRRGDYGQTNSPA